MWFLLILLALKIVLGSLYLDELEIKAEQVESVIAAASMLHLDSVIKKCAEIMVETLSFKVSQNAVHEWLKITNCF